MLSSLLQNVLSTIKQVFQVLGFVIRLTLRSFRLQLLTQISKWRHRQEQPKVAFLRNNLTAIIISLPHLVPLTAGITLILMNTAFPRIFHNVGENTITTLQFVGKALENFSQASLKVQVLDVVRRQVLTNEGLPFGSLVSHLQITDPSYLWSLELWGSFSALHTKARKHIALLLFIIGIVLLNNVVGPSGNVLLIPRAMTRDTSRTLLLLDDESTLFPSTVDTIDSNTFGPDAMQLRFLDWTRDHERPLADAYTTRNMLSYPYDADKSMYNPDQMSTNATTSSSIAAQQIARAFPFATVGRGYDHHIGATLNTTSRQPYVRTRCLIDTYDLGVPAQDLKFSDDDPEVEGAITVGDILQYPSSELFLHAVNQSLVPQRKYSTLLAYGSYDETATDVTLTTCSVETMWIETSLGQLSGDLIDFSFDGYPDEQPRPELIDLTDNWLDQFKGLLLQNNDIVSMLANYSTQENAAGWFLGRLFVLAVADSVTTTDPQWAYDTTHEADKEIKLSAYNESLETTDQFNQLKKYVKDNHLNDRYDGIVLVAKPNWKNLDALTRQEMVTLRSVHTYSSKSLTVQLSLAVMTTYCLVTIVYLGAVAWTGVTGHSWDSISELITLALNSRTPQHLNNVSVGIDTMDTYKEMVSIQANDHDRLELRFHHDPGASVTKWRDVEANRKY